MSRILQALKQLEARPEAAPAAEAAPQAEGAPAVASPAAVAAPPAEEAPAASLPLPERPVTERIAPRRKPSPVRRTAPPTPSATHSALATAEEVEQLLAGFGPGVIECWSTGTAESQAIVSPPADALAIEPAAPHVVLQDCLPTVIEIRQPAPAAVADLPTLEPGAETEIELEFRTQPRRTRSKPSKAKRKTPLLEAEQQVRSAVRGTRVTGITRPTAWETTIRADLEDARHRAPLERLIARWREDRAPQGTTSLLIASLGDSLSAAEITLRAAALLAEHDGTSVLVVDGDPQGALSRRLAIVGKPGLSDLLTPADAHGETIFPTATARLHVLPRGRGAWPATANAAAVEKLLAELAQDYAWILVAGGDARAAAVQALARACSGAYTVVPLGATDVGAAREQLAALQSAGARVLGAVAVAG